MTTKNNSETATTSASNGRANSIRSICHIPSGEMLRLHSVTHWLRLFADKCGRKATEVVLPGVGYSGPLYTSAVQRPPADYAPSNLLSTWVREARTELGGNGTVWCALIPELGFLRNEAIWIRNQYQISLSQACMTNPYAQMVLRDLIDEIVDLGVDGVALDCTDIYPCSGSTGIEGISAHCFCNYCLKALAEADWHERPQAFQGPDGLMRFVLKITETGADHIDPPQSWIDSREAETLIQHSKARQFVDSTEVGTEAQATRLLSFLAARNVVTANSIRTILQAAATKDKRTAAILNSADTDLSQLVTLQALDRQGAADEFWLPDAPDKRLFPGSWVANQYLAPRASYYYNAFFEFVEKARDNYLQLGPERFLGVLLGLSKKLKAGGLSGGSGHTGGLSGGAVYVVSKLPHYSGFVGIPFSDDDQVAIVDRLSREQLGVVLPDHVLAQFGGGKKAPGLG